MFKDNKDFYPTPEVLFRQLMSGKRFLDGKILEPSAGKGDMIGHIKKLMGYREMYDIDAIESDERLSSILMQNDINVVWDDFLTYQTYKEYDHIIMNPPFSDGVDHALKAIELAENQISHCMIHMILNKETINNAYSNKRKELLNKLEKYDAEIRYVNDSFVNAERKTDVEVALINISVMPNVSGEIIYEKLNLGGWENDKVEHPLETTLSTYVESSEIRTRLNDMERLVQEYQHACEVATKAFKAIHKKQSFYSYISKVNSSDGISSDLSSITHYEKKFEARHLNHELDNLRRGYWELILNTGEFRKVLTNDARQKLNRQLAGVHNMEINYTNIKAMLMALQQNQEDILLDSIISIFKRITKYHMNQYSNNVHYYNGWKTNDAYKINHKIIIPISSDFDGWDFKEDYNSINRPTREFIDDLIRALQLIDPDVDNDFETISNQEFENDTLRFKMFLKGTVHVWFKDKKLLDKLNYIAGQHFNWIPSEEEQEQDKKAREFVAREFGDIGQVKLIAS